MPSAALLLAKVIFLVGFIVGTSYGCTSGYTPDHGNCYRFYNAEKNWDQARKNCQQSEGDLALIETVQEANNVKTLRQNTGRANTYYWIGGRQQPHASSPFQWLNGNSIDYDLWSNGEPSHANTQTTQCINLGITGEQMKMKDKSCSASFPFMCEKKCSSGWHDNQFGSCYKFVTNAKTWTDAKNHCQQLGGNLAVLNTQAKAEEMKLLRENTGNKSSKYWIGARQEKNAKGAFKWVNGKRFYNGLWYSGEPNQVDFSNRRCVTVGTGSQNCKMNDSPCTSTRNYICERDI